MKYRSKTNSSGRLRHRKLRAALLSAGWEHAELADALGISHTSVSNRMRGKYPWMVDEAWEVMALLGIDDPAELGRLFPRGGEDDDG